MASPSASLAARLSRACLRRSVRPRVNGEAGAEAAARALDLRWPWPPAGAAEADPETAGEWIRARSARGRLLYLHGGAFMAGSPRLYRSTARFFAKAGFDVFTPAYRLAPEHRFPAALDDVTAAYQRLAAHGPPALAGDSAGGGLALALMLRLRARGLPLPRAAALFSPWTDLSASGASARDNEGKDPIFTRRALRLAARQYLGEASLRDTEASPLFGDLTGLPPILVHVGEDELLLDDSRRLAERAAAAGTAVELTIFPGVPHGWQLGAAFMPEARQSLREAAAFLARFATG
ncbi:Acetyl+esterase [Methylocapsa aurea]|uniref:alpha/beta hydrolase n=1 Tax=Methylocapsa aurea TaxID=663610 RepID=UPI003D18A3A7